MNEDYNSLKKKVSNLSSDLEDLSYNFSKKVGNGSVFNADQGNLGGFKLFTDHVGDKADSMGMSSVITAGDDIRFWAGATFANRSSAPFYVTEAGALFASSATITGPITATSGTIGGWSINTTSIYTGTEDHSGYTANAGDITLYSDGADASLHAFNWYIDTTGKFFSTSGALSGVSITAVPNDTSTDISLLEKTWTMTFSVTDADTIAWTSGTVTLSNGRTFSISSGNTGNMAALTYIYIDPSVSSTVLQTTTTASTAMGANKCLIGTAVNNTVTASFIPYGPGQPLVDGANIGALSIVAANIAASTITGAKIAATTITASNIAANTITAAKIAAGTITTTEIAATTIVAGNIAANTITGTQISSLSVSGKSCTFDTGTIGGFTMSATDLSATNFNVVSGAANTARLTVGTGSNIAGLNSGNAASDIAFWAGDTHANRATAPFRVTEAGAVTMTNATVTGVLTASAGSTLFDAQTFSASGTWTKPSAANANSTVEVWVFGAGGGGGSGARAHSANNWQASGGSGGGGGSIGYKSFLASSLGSTETVTVGTGGTGGTGVAVDDTNGNSGTNGGTTSFGTTTLLKANGGTGGGGGVHSGGTAPTGGAGGVVGNGELAQAGGAGGDASNADADGSAGTDTATLQSSRGGGAGGGINAAGGNRGGGVGGGFITNYVKAGGAVATVGNSSIALFYGGTGGGGSSASSTSASTGGAGINGSGGGGGGAAHSTTGAGGAGGTGYCVVITRF